MVTCKDCKFYGVCIMNRRSADADVSNCKVYEAGMVFEAKDLVEVVRCKKCKYGKLDDTIYSKTIDGETNDTTLYCCHYRWDCNEHHKADHFCSYGRRKDDERKVD